MFTTLSLLPLLFPPTLYSLTFPQTPFPLVVTILLSVYEVGFLFLIPSPFSPSTPFPSPASLFLGETDYSVGTCCPAGEPGHSVCANQPSRLWGEKIGWRVSLELAGKIQDG